MRCAICNVRIKQANGEVSAQSSSVRALNPLSFKWALMHEKCYREALERSKHIPSTRFEYASRYDELMTRYF